VVHLAPPPPGSGSTIILKIQKNKIKIVHWYSTLVRAVEARVQWFSDNLEYALSDPLIQVGSQDTVGGPSGVVWSIQSAKRKFHFHWVLLGDEFSNFFRPPKLYDFWPAFFWGEKFRLNTKGK
jgi:hypothetical protein